MGGDGSLGMFIQQASAEPVVLSNLKDIIFVPLPYGTGNDLCRSLGWGAIEGKWAKNLSTLVKELMWAKEDRLAFWDIEMHAQNVQEF